MKKIISSILSILLPITTLVTGISVPNQIVRAQATTTTGPEMSTCQFIDFMASIQVVTPTNAANARVTFGCNNTVQTNSTIKADVKVNGEDSGVVVKKDQTVTVSWTSTGATSCYVSNGKKTLSGSEKVKITKTETFTISCSGASGSLVSDSVTVRTEEDKNKPLSVSCLADTSSMTTNGAIVWIANPSGGQANYTYSWTGSDGLMVSGSQYVLKAYLTAGIKNATVTIKSGNETAVSSCSANMILPTPSATSTSALSTTATSSGMFVPDTTATSSNSNSGLVTGAALENSGAVTVHFAGLVYSQGGCADYDGFYRLILTPFEGEPVVSDVEGADPAKYGKGDPNVVLSVMYYEYGKLPTPGGSQSIFAGSSDGVQSYECTADLNIPSGRLVDAGVAFAAGQITEAQQVAGAMGEGETEEENRDEISAAAATVKEEDDGFLGTGLSTGQALAVIGAVAAVASCMAGCVLVPFVGASTGLTAAGTATTYWVGSSVVSAGTAYVTAGAIGAGAGYVTGEAVDGF